VTRRLHAGTTLIVIESPTALGSQAASGYSGLGMQVAGVMAERVAGLIAELRGASSNFLDYSSRLSAFGLEMSNEGKSGCSAPFSSRPARPRGQRPHASRSVAAPVTNWLIDAVAVQPGATVPELAAGAGAGFAVIERLGRGGRLI